MKVRPAQETLVYYRCRFFPGLFQLIVLPLSQQGSHQDGAISYSHNQRQGLSDGNRTGRNQTLKALRQISVWLRCLPRCMDKVALCSPAGLELELFLTQFLCSTPSAVIAGVGSYTWQIRLGFFGGEGYGRKLARRVHELEKV